MTRQRQDSSGPFLGRFCPPPKGPIEWWLDRITQLGGELFELDGRTLPLIHEPDRAFWRTRALEAGLEFERDTPSASLARAVVDCETVKAIEEVAPQHPGRNLRFCLEGSYMRRLEDAGLGEITAYLKLTPQGDARSVRRIISAGDSHWAALGAWPWAISEAGRLPPDWRLDPQVALELASWHERARAAAAERLRRDAARLRRAEQCDSL